MKKIAVIVIALALTLGLAGSAMSAGWTSMQGAMGEVASLANISAIGKMPYGLTFTQRPNLNNSVQYQIPTMDGARGVTAVSLKYKRGGALGRISAASVYCAGFPLRTVAIGLTPAVGAIGSYIIPLGARYFCPSGVGLSYTVANGNAFTTFHIYDSAAFFVP